MSFAPGAAITTLARWGVRAGGILMLAAAMLVSIDVIARKLFSVTLGGADELSGYAFAIACAWSFAFVTIERMNVRIDALYRVLPARVARLLDLLSIVALTLFALLLVRYGWNVIEASWRLNARSNSALAVVLWVPQAIWWLGLLLFLGACVQQGLRASVALWRRDWTAMIEIAGARSALDDAEEEVRTAQGRSKAAYPSQSAMERRP